MNFIRQHINFLEFVPVKRRIVVDRVIQAIAMESMHAGENVKLLVEKSLKAFLTLVTGIDFNAPVLNHPEFLFERFGVGRVTVHQHFESCDLFAVAFERLADFVFEIFDFDVLVEVRQQVFDFYHF